MKVLRLTLGLLFILGLYSTAILSAAVVFLLALSHAVLDIEGQKRRSPELTVTSAEVTYVPIPAGWNADR